ncbi:type VII secretion system-associated protein [Nocardia brasiliensis]|uniref:type VII secretion system-associated protein n=1 Tax=Nocardia brasiliensis TaxID=37326 RepID=UPI003D8DCB21
MIDQPIPVPVRQGNWFVLLDPSWTGSDPPAEAIVGGWMVARDGGIGPFQPNPRYVPADESVPTDPIDALLRAAADGAAVGEQLVTTIRASVVLIACDEKNQPIVMHAPDSVPSVLVATAERHTVRPMTDRWWPVVGERLPRFVPHGVDVLLNPSSPARFRLLTEALRQPR